MCTVVILWRPRHDWPLVLAANRDEMVDRPWQPPGRHWADRPQVVGGLDRLAGGTWLALNDSGVVAGVLNRVDTLGPKPGYRSRGELPLAALAHGDAEAAAAAIAGIDTADYRSFNAVVADQGAAFWLRSREGEPGVPPAVGVEVMALPPGLSMITARDRNDPESPRIRRYLPQFEGAAPPDPAAAEWSSWTALLASRLHAAEAGPTGAMNVVTESGFATTSSSLIGLARAAAGGPRPVWLFSGGRPGEFPYQPVAL